MSSIRKEQGRALLDFVNSNSCGSATVICGDFNAQPDEPVYELLLQSPMNLDSAYAAADHGEEPQYTSWKIREDGEQRQTLDYIFYSKNRLAVDSVLQFPTEGEIGQCRLPSLKYPSDHLSLVCDLSFKWKRERNILSPSLIYFFVSSWLIYWNFFFVFTSCGLRLSFSLFYH